MKRRKNTPEGKKLATILCEASDEETLESVGELILSLALPNLGEGEQEIISDAEIGGGITPIVSFIRFYVWNPKGRAKALDAFATELARLFSSSPKVYVIHAKYAMGGVYVEVICRKVAASHSSWKRYIKMFSHGMQIYSGQKQNPKRRKNSQESDALEKLICSSSKPSLRQALELIPLLWEGNSDSITKSWTFGQQGIWFKFDNHADAYDMFKYYSKFFALNMKIAIVFEKDPRQLNVYTVYILCWSPTNPTMQWIQGQARNGFVLLRIGGQDMSNVPPKRKNSGQYARELADILCGGEAPSALELVKSLYDADWDNIFTQALKARKELRFDFHHDVTDLSAVRPFVQYWKQYFANDPRVYVFAHSATTYKGTRVYISCSRSKVGPIKRKNSGHLPPISLGKKLEALLCSKGDATLDQFGDLIRSFFPDIHTFTHWGNLFGSADVDFDFSKVSKADEFEKWAKKAFSKKIDIWKPTAHSVGLICQGITIRNPKRRRNSSHLPPTSLGKKLEPLLCSKDDATREQFGDLIRSFFPDIHNFIHLENPLGFGSADFDFSKVSKADEFEKWAKKAFSKNIYIWRPFFTNKTVWLTCRSRTIPNPKRRRNTKGRDLGYGTNNGSMVKNQLKSIHRIAKELDDALYGTDRLPDWVQSKVTVALDRLVVAQNYLLSKLEGYKSNPKCNVNSAITKGKEACKLIRANKSTK